jgi:hypothetical protein
MSKHILLLLALLAAVPLFLAGALRRPAADSPSPFIVQPVAVAPELAGPRATPRDLLDRAVERLSPDCIAWLRVGLWQRMYGPETEFASEGTLQLGPEHCARLELTVHHGSVPARWLVVSDGHALAHVIQVGKCPPSVTSRLLLGNDSTPAEAPKSPDQSLRELGCGGPYPLLKELRTRLREVQAETGLFREQPIVRLKGRLVSAGPSAAPASAVAADFCYLYLDARSLWPGRLEWWGASRTSTPRLLLEMEFRNPELNRPLSLSQCVRAFSYRPEDSP